MNTKGMNTKEKVIGVAVILVVTLAAAAIARELWAVFTIVGLLAFAYLFVKQEEDKPQKEVIISDQE